MIADLPTVYCSSTLFRDLIYLLIFTWVCDADVNSYVQQKVIPLFEKGDGLSNRIDNLQLFAEITETS